MSRIQLALDVDDLESAVGFYSTLFGIEPAKRKPGYANFAIDEPPLKLVLIENPGRGGNVNHLGVEVESTQQVRAEIARLSQAGLFTEEQIATTCCYATQDKVWVTGPNGERWEIYTVLADTEDFGAAPAPDDDTAPTCCGTNGRRRSASETATEAPAACCAPAVDIRDCRSTATEAASRV